jgi:recombination protein RecT
MSERQITLKDQLTAIKPRFIELTDKKTYEKEVSFALQHIGRNNQLKKATTESKLEAVMNVAQCGLSLNPVLKLAYLVPRSENINGQWGVKCCLEPSYQGLCKLVTDTGSARQIYAHLVYEGDEFGVDLGTSPTVTHHPKFQTKNIQLVYMVAVLSDGSKAVEVMTMEDIENIRERSESYKAFKAGKIKSCVWESDLGEMARKTVVRRGVKYLPKTDMWDKLGQAISLDEEDYQATHNQMDRIEDLLITSIIQPEEQTLIYSEINTMSQERAREVIIYLSENQVDRVGAGLPYDQKDIKEKQNNN